MSATFWFFFYSLLVLFMVVCLFLILLVLIQKGRGGGIASAFGGMGGNTAFGSKTGDVLTWATSVVFGVFLLLAIVLNLLANYQSDARKRAMGGTPAADVAPTPAESTPVALPPAAPGTQPEAPAIPGTQPAATGG